MWAAAKVKADQTVFFTEQQITILVFSQTLLQAETLYTAIDAFFYHLQKQLYVQMHSPLLLTVFQSQGKCYGFS